MKKSHDSKLIPTHPCIARESRRFYAGCGFAVLLLALTGCWSSATTDAPAETEAKELKTSKDPLSTEVPEAELIGLSKKLYQVGMYTVARDSLASLKDRYPLGAYANFAELKYADSFFFNREYNEAAKAYENFIKNYPGSPELPYVKLQAARAHVASARDAGRDRAPWERGLTMYDELVSAYPGSAYADVAFQERARVVGELSKYDREIIEFYRRQGNIAAVAAREQRFQERWGERLAKQQRHDAEASDQEYRKLMDMPLQSDHPVLLSEAVLASSTSAPLPSQADTSEDDGPAQQAPQEPSSNLIAINAIDCHNSSPPFATVELSSLSEAASQLLDSLSLTPVNGITRIEPVRFQSGRVSWDCFGAQDVRLTPLGVLEMSTERRLLVNTLKDPPRLLISEGN